MRSSNRYGAAKRTGADKRHALIVALGNMTDARVLQLQPADLTWTGADLRECECRLLARQAAIRRRDA